MARQTASEFIKNGLLEARTREACFLISRLLDDLSNYEIHVNDINSSEISVGINALMINMILLLEGSQVKSIEFRKLSFANYDYFTNTPCTSFVVELDGNLDKVVDRFVASVVNCRLDFTKLKMSLAYIDEMS